MAVFDLFFYPKNPEFEDSRNLDLSYNKSPFVEHSQNIKTRMTHGDYTILPTDLLHRKVLGNKTMMDDIKK